MKQLAFVTIGHSEYAERLWRIVQERSDFNRRYDHPFVSLDGIDLLPYFVIAGASIETDAGDRGLAPGAPHTTFSFRVLIPEGDEEHFYADLQEALDEVR